MTATPIQKARVNLSAFEKAHYRHNVRWLGSVPSSKSLAVEAMPPSFGGRGHHDAPPHVHSLSALWDACPVYGTAGAKQAQ
eukprot:2322025-Amphidinium_carterae.1